MNLHKSLIVLLVFSILGMVMMPGVSLAFVQPGQYSSSNPAGLIMGIWHGLLAPYSLIARFFIVDVIMYATPNIGWLYDAGFLLGVSASLPIGWIAAILSTIAHLY